MLTVWLAIILGVVEGMTEFIPVSSTGHMILTTKLWGVSEQSELLKTFEVMIQLGAILAITLVYKDRIRSMFGMRYRSMQRGSKKVSNLNLMHVTLGIGPALVVAFFAKDWIKQLFSVETVVAALIVGGCFMWFAEWLGTRRTITAETVDDLSYKQAFLIGIYQILSVLWPGFSRSGATISGGMLSGASYRASADFSFLLAIPIMIIASVYELIDSISSFNWTVSMFFLLGFIVSFVVAYIVVVAFLKHIQRIKLRYFAWYRFVLAGLFWWFVMK